MDFTVVLYVIAVLYGVLLFFDNFFKTCAHYPYIKFLEGTGVQINFFWIRWKTKAFNRTLIKWGANRPRFWNTWFTIGVYVSLVLLPVSLALLIYSIFQNSTNGNKSDTIIIEPIIPGVNLPASELGYYSLSLIACSIVHELGHALAAVQEDVNLIEVGANIFFVLPVAFVNISNEKLSPSLKSLRIFCAGVWHNVVLALLAYLMYLSIPFLFSILFDVNKGIVISEITKNSPLLGSKGLNVGDVIINVNGCKVFDENSWYSCMAETHKHKIAFCIEADTIRNLDESTSLRHLDNGNLECCSEDQPDNVCFEYLDNKGNGILELPMHACLPARKIVEQSKQFCNQSPHICPTSQFCFKPILDNSTYLFKLSSEHRDIIYLGLPGDIYSTIWVSSFVPKYFFTTPSIADTVLKFTKYLLVFSSGLAVLNVIPFMYMDGQYIIEIIGYWLLENKYGKSTTRAMMVIITWFFTFLLICHCLYFAFKAML